MIGGRKNIGWNDDMEVDYQTLGIKTGDFTPWIAAALADAAEHVRKGTEVREERELISRMSTDPFSPALKDSLELHIKRCAKHLKWLELRYARFSFPDVKAAERNFNGLCKLDGYFRCANCSKIRTHHSSWHTWSFICPECNYDHSFLPKLNPEPEVIQK